MLRKFYLLCCLSMLAIVINPSTISAQLQLPFSTVLLPFNDCYECNVFNPMCPQHTQLWSQLYPNLTVKSTHGSPDIEMRDNLVNLRLWYYKSKSEGFFVKYDFKPYITYRIRIMASNPGYFSGSGNTHTNLAALYVALTNGLQASSTTNCDFGTIPTPTGDNMPPQQVPIPGNFQEMAVNVSVPVGKSYSQLFMYVNSAQQDTGGVLIRSVFIDEYRHFDFGPLNITLACGDVAPRTFTINNPLNISGITSYKWEIGPGWLYNGQPAPSVLSTTTTSIQLKPSGNAVPGNVSVTPMQQESGYEKYTCTVKQNPPTQPQFTTTTGTVCNQSANFAVGAVADATHYLWEAENANLRINGASSPALLPAATGNAITLTDVSATFYSSWVSVKSYNAGCGYSPATTQLLNVGVQEPVPYYSDGLSISTETPILYGQANVCSGKFRVGLTPTPLGSVTWTKIAGTYPFAGSTGNFVNGNIAVSQWITFRGSYQTSCGTRYQEFTIWGVKCSGGIDKSMMKAERFSIYPNPTTSYILLTDNANQDQNANKEIALYDLSNNLVLKIQSHNSQTTINTANLKRGNYYLEVRTGNQREVKQLILK